MTVEQTADRKTYLQMYLHGDSLQMDHALIMRARCGAVALEVLEYAFGPLFGLLGVSERLLEIRKGL